MADIAADHTGAWERVSMGNKIMEFAKIEGDGSGVTVRTRMGHPQAGWVQAIDDIDGSSHLPVVPGISIAGNTVTYAAAPTTGKYHWLFVMGYD